MIIKYKCGHTAEVGMDSARQIFNDPDSMSNLFVKDFSPKSDAEIIEWYGGRLCEYCSHHEQQREIEKTNSLLF